MGVSQEKPLYQQHEDLSELAGAWSQQEAEEFEANAACFGNIDPELFRRSILKPAKSP